MDILFSDFRKKDVIDVCTGKKLGRVKDLTFGFPDGRVKSFSVSGGMFGCGDEVVFKFNRVEKIGEDAILIGPEEKSDDCPPPKCPPPGKPCPPQGGQCKPDKPPFPRFDDGDYE